MDVFMNVPNLNTSDYNIKPFNFLRISNLSKRTNNVTNKGNKCSLHTLNFNQINLMTIAETKQK